MKNTIRLLMILSLIPQGLQAQTATTSTRLNAAITASATRMTVASATGFSASTDSVGQWAYIEKEAAKITAVSGTTITIQRGQLGTVAKNHRSAVLVWAGPRDAFRPDQPFGECTRANETRLPQIHAPSGKIYDCILSTTGTTNDWVGLDLNPVAVRLGYKKLPVTATTYTLLANDEVVGYNTNVNGTFTLPAISGLFGKRYVLLFEVSGTHTVNVLATGSETINGMAVGTGWVMGINSAPVTTLYYDGVSEWYAR